MWENLPMGEEGVLSQVILLQLMSLVMAAITMLGADIQTCKLLQKLCFLEYNIN